MMMGEETLIVLGFIYFIVDDGRYIDMQVRKIN